MNQVKKLNEIKKRRQARVRGRIFGTADAPRLSIFRSNRITSVQLIDDAAQKTLAAASSHEIKKKHKKTEGASEVGQKIASKALALGISKAKVDRGPYRYHGRIKALVEAARKGGLKI